jgi:hypothetical protein
MTILLIKHNILFIAHCFSEFNIASANLIIPLCYYAGLALAGANEQIGSKIIKLAQENHDWLKLTKSMTFGISSLNLAFSILRMEKYTSTTSVLSLLISKQSDTVYFLWVIDWFIFVTSVQNEILI